MQFFIANFSQIRYMNENCIVISTCSSDPKFFHNNSYNKDMYFIDKNNVLNGIREESFLLPDGVFEQLDEHCEANCPWKYKNPNCGFLKAYGAHLATLDFELLLSEFNRVAEDVRKITHYKGDPVIILLVWESVNNPCSERYAIQELFKSHGLEIKNFENKGDLSCAD